MTIIKTNVDTNDKRALYKLTKSSGLMAQDAPVGVSTPVSSWALYSDSKEARDGTVKEQTVLSFVSTDGSKYSTISQTFIREFEDIVSIMDGEPFAILIRHGTTRGGKKFVTCELDCDYSA